MSASSFFAVPLRHIESHFDVESQRADMANDQERKLEPGSGALAGHSDSESFQKGEEAASASLTRPGTDSMDSPQVEWKASRSTKLAFASICVLALMAALDGTSIGVALPVSKINQSVLMREKSALVADGG